MILTLAIHHKVFLSREGEPSLTMFRLALPRRRSLIPPKASKAINHSFVKVTGNFLLIKLETDSLFYPIFPEEIY